MNNLTELRERVKLTILPIILLFLISFTLSEYVITFLLNYYGVEAYALQVMESLSTQLKIASVLTGIFGLPLLTYHAVAYISPAYNIKNSSFRIVLAQILGIEGIILGATAGTKYIVESLTGSQIVETVYSLSNIIELGIGIGLGFGVAFQIMILFPILAKVYKVPFNKGIKLGIPLFIISYIVSAIITPPDIVSTIIVLLPVTFSYIVGLGLAQLPQRRKTT